MTTMLPALLERMTSLPVPTALRRPSTVMVAEGESAMTLIDPAAVDTFADLNRAFVNATLSYADTTEMSPPFNADTVSATTSPAVADNDTGPGVACVPAVVIDKAVRVPSAVTLICPPTVVLIDSISIAPSLSMTMLPGADADRRPTFVRTLMELVAPAAVPAVSRAVPAWSLALPPMFVAAVRSSAPPKGRKMIGSAPAPPTTTAVRLLNAKGVVPVPVAVRDRVIVVPSGLLLEIVVFAGMPTPVTSMPTSSDPVEDRFVTVAELRVVVPRSRVVSLNCQVVSAFCSPDVTYTVVPRVNSLPVSASVARVQAPAATT